jgi:hypothetical protein
MSKNLKFEKLKEKWYSKLKREGFEDIEKDEDSLKVWSSTIFGKTKALIQHGGWQAKATYYQMASTFLSEYKFDNDRERKIWEKHSEGLSMRDISVSLGTKRSKTYSRTYVWMVIKKLRIKMFDMYMSPKQDQYE